MKNTAYSFVTFISIIAILVIGKELLIPFVFALIFWFLTREIRNSIKCIPVLKKYLPNWINNTIVLLVIILLFGAVSEIITASIAGLVNSIGKYQANINNVLMMAEKFLPEKAVSIVNNSVQSFDYVKILTGITKSISGILGNMLMIILYALFVFAEESIFETKLKKIFEKEKQYEKVSIILLRIEKSISGYLKLKTFVSLLTGVLSYIVLISVGVDSSLFWAFLIFLLNFIPTIGSLIATIFPAVFSLIQFGTFIPSVIVLICVGIIQLIVGNVIEPKVMGKSLNLSPLVAIVSLAVWGKIWGITGMLLSVPIMVIVIIVFSQFEKTKSIAILLSENGDV